MRIALTYDLKSDHAGSGLSPEQLAELDDRSSIEAIECALAELGHRPVPVGNLHQVMRRLARGERWELVFNLAEGLYGFGREAAVPALLDAHRIPYTFADPLTLTLCLHKASAKRIVRDAGFSTPPFALVSGAEDLEAVDLPFPLFAKPVAEGTSKGIGVACEVDTRADLATVCFDLLQRFAQPVLVERFLPGRELTVGILGTGPSSRCLGVLEIAFGPGAEGAIYSYRNKSRADWRQVLSYRLVGGPLGAEAEALALGVWRLLGGRDAGRVDLKLDAEGHPQFLEINPLAGLAPGASDLTILCDLLGIPYRQLIGEIVASALERAEPARRAIAVAAGSPAQPPHSWR